jgi:hypothetical protein
MKPRPADDLVTLQVPRSALQVVAAPPEFVHQGIVETIIGLPARDYLALSKRGAWPVVREGRRILARREAVLAYLDQRAAPIAKPTKPAPTDRGFENDPPPKGFSRAS